MRRCTIHPLVKHIMWLSPYHLHLINSTSTFRNLFIHLAACRFINKIMALFGKIIYLIIFVGIGIIALYWCRLLGYIACGGPRSRTHKGTTLAKGDGDDTNIPPGRNWFIFAHLDAWVLASNFLCKKLFNYWHQFCSYACFFILCGCSYACYLFLVLLLKILYVWILFLLFFIYYIIPLFCYRILSFYSALAVIPVIGWYFLYLLFSLFIIYYFPFFFSFWCVCYYYLCWLDFYPTCSLFVCLIKG